MITRIHGLKFPDEYVIRFFFKMGLHHLPGRVLELGCGNGNNLLLFSQYGWDVTGVDLSSAALHDAHEAFSLLAPDSSSFRFIRHDLSSGLPRNVGGDFDCLLLPNIVCYLKRDAWERLAKELARLLRPGAPFFLRTRSQRDYRYGRGTPAGPASFVLATPETGEEGLINTFYTERELEEQVTGFLHAEKRGLVVLHVDFDNPQGGRIITNSDIVVWGRVRE